MEIARTHGVDVPLIGATKGAIQAIQQRLGGDAGSSGAERHGFLRAAVERLEASRAGERVATAGHRGALQVADALRGLGALIRPTTTIVEDATTSGGAVQRFLPRLNELSFMTSVSGSLGWGLGAALGVQLPAPDREVVAVIGDGVFQFGMPALWTAARYRSR